MVLQMFYCRGFYIKILTVNGITKNISQHPSDCCIRAFYYSTVYPQLSEPFCSQTILKVFGYQITKLHTFI